MIPCFARRTKVLGGCCYRPFKPKLTRRRLKHGAFHSLVDLQAAIKRFVAEHNTQPKPFIWKADPDKIIAARNRGFQTLASIY